MPIAATRMPKAPTKEPKPVSDGTEPMDWFLANVTDKPSTTADVRIWTESQKDVSRRDALFHFGGMRQKVALMVGLIFK